MKTNLVIMRQIVEELERLHVLDGADEVDERPQLPRRWQYVHLKFFKFLRTS